MHPPKDLLYVGWTEPGEWFNVTVDAARAGVYTGDLLYTSNRGGTIFSLQVTPSDQTLMMSVAQGVATALFIATPIVLFELRSARPGPLAKSVRVVRSYEDSGRRELE